MRYEFFDPSVSPPHQFSAQSLTRVLLQRHIMHDFKVVDAPQYGLQFPEPVEPFADDDGVQENEQFERVTHFFRGDTELVQLPQTIAFAGGGSTAQSKQAFRQYGKNL